MRQSIPPVPMRAQIVDAQGRPTRAILDFLQALRLSVGGDTATVAPAEQASVLAPVALVLAPERDLSICAVPFDRVEVAPVALSIAEPSLDPVCGCGMAQTGLEPV